MNAPLTGVAALRDGLRLIFRPELRRFVVAPLTINWLLFAFALWWGLGQIERALNWLEGLLPGWLHWLEWLLWPLFVLAAVGMLFFAFALIGNLIAAPFNTLLAERTEALLTGRAPAAPADSVLGGLLGTLLDELRKLWYALTRALAVLAATLLVPPLGPPLGFLFAAWMLALEYSDYPLGNRGLRFRAIRARVRQRLGASLGFGASVAVLTAIPGVNFIVMPAAVAGATALWVRDLGEDAPPR